MRFEKIERSFSNKMHRFFIYILTIIGIAFIFRVAFDLVVSSPKVNYFGRMNKSLELSLKDIGKKISDAEVFLKEIQGRDDNIYRSFFMLEPIPGSIREAGVGGSQNMLDGLIDRGGTELVKETATKLEKLNNKVKIQSYSFSDLFKYARIQKIKNLSKPTIQPMSPVDSFWLTSTFGYRKDPFSGRKRMHAGIDLAGQPGLKVFATGDGVVINAENSMHGYGKEVIVNHGFGYITRYAHLQKIIVKRGQKISRGQLLGNLGNTGRSTGPHLHYEVLFNNKPVNPMYYYFDNLTSEEYAMISALNSHN